MSLTLSCKNLELIPDFGSFRDILYGAAISYSAKKVYQHRKKIVNKKSLTTFYIALFMIPTGVIEISNPDDVWDFTLSEIQITYSGPSPTNTVVAFLHIEPLSLLTDVPPVLQTIRLF